jgi:ubiquinone/menaquinone biosynthesis C-methylase UbiE
MAEQGVVADHYSHGGLLEAIGAGVRALGKTPESVTLEDLGPVDEFHIGGRQASTDFIGQLRISPVHHALDVGCGLGGTSRFVADACGCKVSGIDLTPEFIETARALCSWVGLSDRIDLHQGSALDMPFETSIFDTAFMLHVGMNIADKGGLFREVHRVLRPGAVFGVYDVMRTSEDPLVYPVPWAATADISAVASPQDYRHALEAAGFEIAHERDRREFATQFFAELRRRNEAADGPPPLGIHLLMGETAATKIANMVANIAAGRISPVEIIARKASS